MKKIISVLVLFAVLLNITVFATDFKVEYSDMILTALEKSELGENADTEHIYVVEENNYIELMKGDSPIRYHIAIPEKDSDTVHFSHFKNGEYVTTVTDFPPFYNIESPFGEYFEKCIENNEILDIKEVTVMAVLERLHMLSFHIMTDDEEYIVPYDFFEDSVFNVTDAEECRLIKGEAYTLEEYIEICEKEAVLYAEYLKEKRAEENKTVITQNEDGDEVFIVGGINLENIKNDILENIPVMEKDSNIKINLSSEDEKRSSVHRYENGSSTNELEKFVENLFEELSVQAGKKADSFAGENACTIKLKYKENGKWKWHHTYIDLSENAVRIRTQNYHNVIFELKNTDAVRDYLLKASENGLKTFDNRYYGENTADVVGNIDGFTKTDIVKFSCVMPENTENDLSKEVASGGSVVSGILERYKENKYNSTYILTLKGNKGTASFYVQQQASLSGDGEKLSNNIPLYFLNQNRYESERLLSYPMKDSNSYNLKMTFVKNELEKVVFEYTDCDILEYTSLTEDTEFEEKFTEREKPSESLKKLGIMQGDPDGNMRLNDNITRAEAVALLVRVHKRLDRKVSCEFTGFSDMKGHWADEEITYAKNAGITDGTSQSTFSPQNNVTVQEFVKMLVSFLGYGEEAEKMGGYPHGYIMMGMKLGILKDISVPVTDAAIRKDVATMLDFSLDVKPAQIEDTETFREKLEEK